MSGKHEAVRLGVCMPLVSDKEVLIENWNGRTGKSDHRQGKVAQKPRKSERNLLKRPKLKMQEVFGSAESI